ncbi:glycosyltransferase [Ancylobacter dichloromethanicus]
MVALTLGVAMVSRYVYWRTTSTLPPVEDLSNFIPALLLYVAEMYSVTLLALSLFVVSAPHPPRTAPAIAPGAEPTVDIFVPSYNEDVGLLATTLAAAVAIDYPRDRFKVWLLDDGGTDQKCEQHDLAAAREAQTRRQTLSELCSQLGVNYLTRPRNEHAKAGNLNHALGHSSGELIVVFDADHAPARSFLRETLGYFNENPRIFLVQTPHFFINPDPVERSLDTWRRMPSEKRDVLRRHPARPRPLGRCVLLRFGRCLAARGPAGNRWISPIPPSPRTAKPPSPCMRAAGTASMSTRR